MPDKIFILLLLSRNVTRRMSTAMMKAFEVVYHLCTKEGFCQSQLNDHWSVSGHTRTDYHLQGCSCLGGQEAP